MTSPSALSRSALGRGVAQRPPLTATWRDQKNDIAAKAVHSDDPPSPRVLLVQGPQRGSEPLETAANALRESGYTVEVARGAHDCLTRMQDPPDLVILGTLKLGMAWTDLCRTIQTGNAVPIVIGTRLESEIDAVLAFELGVSGYVSDASRTRELVARARAALRPITSKPASVNGFSTTERAVDAKQFAAGKLKIDLVGRDVTVGSNSVYLARREFDLLSALLSPPGRVRTRDELIELVWKGRSRTGSRTLDTHIRKLRLKLEDDPVRPHHLVTVRGVGFRFDTEVLR